MKKVKINLEVYANFKGNRASVPELLTYLLEENKKLKEENQHIFANVNDDELLRSNAMMSADICNLNERINKAIELLYNETSLKTLVDRSKIVEILKGEEK